jgi:opacity protein-like surface antigen
MKKLLVATAFLLLASAAFAQDCSTSTITFETEAVAQQFVGVPAHFDFIAVGGNPPYTMTITSGTLPAGLHLSPNGKLRGKPTQVAEETIFIELRDSEGCGFTQAFPISVMQP